MDRGLRIATSSDSHSWTLWINGKHIARAERNPAIRDRVDNLVLQLARLLDAYVTLISLGYLTTSFGLRTLEHQIDKKMKDDYNV